MSLGTIEPEILVGGRYRLDSELGRGGTAVVYRAEDTLLGVPRAVKFLEPAFVGTSLRDRLWKEARAMASIANPHLLNIYDVGDHNGIDYIVMAVADGGSLSDWLEAHGALGPAAAVGFTIQILCALDIAHAAGIVHRDVKPANVLLDHTGLAMLADFGIALIDSEELYRHTRAGVMMGSLAFMAPEQRQDARSVTEAADIYATGASLYNLLTNQLPMDLFTAGASSSRWQGIPPELAKIIQRAVALEPEDRFASAREMALSLASLPLGAASGPVTPSAAATSAAIRSMSDTAHSVQRPSLQPTAGRTLVAEDTVGGLADLPDDISSGTILPLETQALPLVELDEAKIERRRRGLLLAVIALLLASSVGGYALWDALQEPPTAAAEAPAVVPPSAPTPEVVAVAAPEEAAPEPEEVAPEPTPEPVAAPEPVAEPPAPEPTPEPVAAPEPAAEAPVAEAPAEPEPVASAEPEAVEDADAGPIAGTWKGSFSGRSATVTLRQTGDTLKGEIQVTVLSRSSVHALRGSYDPATRKVYLEDVDDSADAGTYTATLSSDSQRLEGRFKTHAGDRSVLFALGRR